MRKYLSKAAIIFLAFVLVMGSWIAADLSRSVRVDIREFDPDEVARLDTAMWRSYYSRERLRLFREAAELLAEQYHFPFWRRQLVAYYAAKSAFVFKDGKSRADYEKALPDLVKFYGEIKGVSTADFDADKAARLELEWWIIHRQRADHQPGDLARALAETAAVIYNVPPESLLEHGQLRAQAMEIRDTKAEEGGVTEADWQQIDELLHRSWRSLHEVVNRK